MARREREPDKPGAAGHIADLVVFRSIGFLLILNEVRFEKAADWHVMAAGFAMFFMPDALRGKSSVVWRVLESVLKGRSEDDR